MTININPVAQMSPPTRKEIVERWCILSESSGSMSVKYMVITPTTITMMKNDVIDRTGTPALMRTPLSISISGVKRVG